MGSVPTPTPTTGSGMSNNLAAALCYIPLCLVGIILAIVFLLIEPYKNDRFVRFHAFQSIFLHVGLIVLSIAWQIVVVCLGSVSHGLAFLISFPISLLIGLGAFLLMLYMLFQAYNNKEIKLPIIGDLAAKQVGG